MKIDHDTLRKYINGQPGDAAGVAAMRGKSGQRQGATNSFREQLTPLVVNQKLSRSEAVQLLSILNNSAELEAKLERLVKANKLTQADAQQLLKSRNSQRNNKTGTRQ